MALQPHENVPEDQVFWVADGGILRNLGDLAGALEHMSDETFGHHVAKGKNDFANWVKECSGDSSLASRMKRVKTRSAMATLVKGAVSGTKPTTKKTKSAKTQASKKKKVRKRKTTKGGKSKKKASKKKKTTKKKTTKKKSSKKKR